MDIISRAEWGARAPRARQTVTWGQRAEVVVHYSEGPTSQTPRSIQDFHMDDPDRRWSDIGYNFLVDERGRVYEGRGWLVVGAHAPGHNTSGIGVCFIGRNGDATPAAETSIRWVYDEACRRAGRTLRKLGHRDVYSTDCPGDQLYAWVRAGMPADKPQPEPQPEPQEEEEDVRYYGQLADGQGFVTPISIHPGDVTSIGFIGDNGLQGLPPAKLRVAIHDAKGWHVERIEVDSTKPKPWIKFPDPKTTDGLSVAREDDGAVHIAWDAS